MKSKLLRNTHKLCLAIEGALIHHNPSLWGKFGKKSFLKPGFKQTAVYYPGMFQRREDFLSKPGRGKSISFIPAAADSGMELLSPECVSIFPV